MAAAGRVWERIPTGVEQDEEWFNAVARRNADKLCKTALEASPVLGPELIVQEDPHSVEPVHLGPAEFGVDAPGSKVSA